MFSILSVSLSIPLAKLSILMSDDEVSSLAIPLLWFLTLATLAKKLASKLIATLYISSNVGGFLSLSWYAISMLKPLGNFINAKFGGGLRLTGTALHILLNIVQ